MASIILVVGNSASLTAHDQLLEARLIAAGHTVLPRDDGASEEAAGTYDGVVISDSSSGATVGSKYDTAAVPGLCTEQPQWRIGSNVGGVDNQQWVVSGSASPQNGGLSGTLTVYSDGTILQQGLTPAGTHTVVATRQDSASVAVYVTWESGAALSSGTAPAKRCFIRIPNTVGATEITADGQTLLDAAIDWTFGTGVAAPTVSAGPDVADHQVDTQFTRTATENDNGSTITARTWEITAGPTGVGTTIGTAAALSWTPTVTGTYTLTYTATNAVGSGSDSLSITVTAAPAAPGSVFDLSNWKVTLPTDGADGDTTADEVTQPALDTYVDSNFFLDTATNRMVMVAPVVGATTPGSGGTRSELREMQAGVEASWTPFDVGVRQLTVSMRPNPTGADPRQEMIVAQIHAGANPAVYLAAEWESSGSPVTPRIRVFKDNLSGSSSGVGNMLSGIAVGDEITVRIRVENDTVSVYGALGGPANLSGTPNFSFNASTDFADQAGWYFKTGSYNKSEVADVGAAGESRNEISFLELIQPSGDVTLAGHADASGSISGAASVARSLQATAPAATEATGSPALSRALEGSVADACMTAAGQFTIARPLAAVASLAADASAALTVDSDVTLGGVGASVSEMTGALTLDRPLEGFASAAAATSAELLAGNFVCQNLTASASAVAYAGMFTAATYGGSSLSAVSRGATAVSTVQYGATDIELCGQ